MQELENRYRETHRTEFWKPFPHQKKALELLYQGKKTILLQGGNRIGKTVFGVNVIGAACLGHQPWDNKPTVWGNTPIQARIICVDWEHHANNVVVNALKEWLPEGSYTTKKNNVGVEAYWTFKNGSKIELLTHIQETKIHEGWKGHLIWADEPLPKDKYAANKRGLVDYSGVFLMTMTAVYEVWVLDELVLKHDDSVGCVTDIPMKANPLLKQEDINNFESSLSEDEKKPRIEGGWLQLSGRVVKEFDIDKHVIDASKIPPDWPVVAMIDVHLSLPNAVGFYAWDEYNRMFVIDEIWEHIAPENIANEIIRRKESNTWNIKETFIDPFAKGDNQFIKNRGIAIQDTFSIIERKLRPFGIKLSVASKDKDSGIININTALKGSNGMPALYFFKTCHKHIWEIQRWIYDKKTGKAKKENDHFCENLYRATLAGVKYIPPEIYSKSLKFNECGVV